MPAGATQPLADGAAIRWPVTGLPVFDQGADYAGHPNSPESAWHATMQAGVTSGSAPRQAADVHEAPDGECSSGGEDGDVNLTRVATLLLGGVTGSSGRPERGPLKSHRLQYNSLGSELSSQRTSFTRTSEGVSPMWRCPANTLSRVTGQG